MTISKDTAVFIGRPLGITTKGTGRRRQAAAAAAAAPGGRASVAAADPFIDTAPDAAVVASHVLLDALVGAVKTQITKTTATHVPQTQEEGPERYAAHGNVVDSSKDRPESSGRILVLELK